MKFMFTFLLVGIIGFAVAQGAPISDEADQLNFEEADTFYDAPEHFENGPAEELLDENEADNFFDAPEEAYKDAGQEKINK